MFLRTIADLSDADVESILARAEVHRTSESPCRSLAGVVVGLVFLDASLRTRVGFAVASARLGATSVTVDERRENELSRPESVADTFRTVCGYADLVVIRTAGPIPNLPPGVDVPVINGGDRGPTQEHPTQALIDLYAIRRYAGPADGCVVALVGDPRMRAARSLLALLERTPPKKIVVVTEPELKEGFVLPPALAARGEYRSVDELQDTDVLYVVGIPHGTIDERGRARLRVDEKVMAKLADRAVVLSPLPVIDEIDRQVVSDPRIRMHDQSADGVFVRMSVLEHVFQHRAQALTWRPS